MNRFEIEMKLPVFSLEEIKEKLIWKGFQEEATVRESDMYYNSEHHDVKKLGEALRIRRVHTASYLGMLYAKKSE